MSDKQQERYEAVKKRAPDYLLHTGSLCSDEQLEGFHLYEQDPVIQEMTEQAKENAAINPSHYKEYEGFEVIDITEQLNFCLGNVVKYVMRAGKKDGNSKDQDLKKAIWYLNRELEYGK